MKPLARPHLRPQFAGLALLGLVLLVLITGPALPSRNEATAASLPAFPPCSQPGWFPLDFGLKDHHVFTYDGYYYLVSIDTTNESRFVYGRSLDLCTWEDLGPILSERTPGAWDELVIWAPFVHQENRVYYLYYTGVSDYSESGELKFTQSIMLATSTNPADPHSWQPYGMVFQPAHAGMVWEAGQWADCRDPTVIKVGGTYYLYYTGLDTGGGIIGLATAPAPTGPWQDQGAVVPANPNSMLESPAVAAVNSHYYLLYHQPFQGAYYRLSNDPAGFWTEARPIGPGWAHEMWTDSLGSWYTSYLTDYTVSISPLIWDAYFNPALPFIGSAVHHLLFPLVVH